MKYTKLLDLGKEAIKKTNINLALLSILLMINPAHAEIQKIDNKPISIQTTNHQENIDQTIASKKTIINVADINDFWNKTITYKSEPPGEDIWQTPEETLKLKTGDCEDFAIAKYFDLIASGVPKENVTLAWVGIKNINKSNTYESHVVVLYKSQDVEYVLDNYNQDIVPLSQRKDLIIAGKLTYDLDASEFYKGNGKHFKEVWGNILKNYNGHIATIQKIKGLPIEPSTLLTSNNNSIKVKTTKQVNNSILTIRNKSLDNKQTSYNKLIN